jgi:molybdate transport system regulatory protein
MSVAPLNSAATASKRSHPSITDHAPVLRFRIRVTAGEVIAIGPGKIDLLEAIDRTGSITAAAKQLDMSYRRAWMLLDQLNGALQRPAVDSAKGGHHGGGSALTEEGRRLVALYRRIEARAASACRADIRHLLELLAR